MNKVPHISVIMPVYNAEKTLSKCIESILNQKFTDFELIIINDGSNDKSQSVCEKYAAQDSRIKLLVQQNKGVSAARNNGLDNVRGKYICFVDADDWVEDEYLSAFFRANRNPDKEIVIQSCFEDRETESTIKCLLPDEVYDEASFSPVFTQLRILGYGYPFAKLYQTDIIEEYNLRFDVNIHFIEDLLFFLNYLQYMQSLRSVSEANYHYISHSTKISLSYSHNRYESEIRAYYSEKKIVETLSIKLNFNDLAVHYVKANNGFIFYRAIRTIYRPQWKKPFSERISILKEQWNKENIYCLQAYSKQSLNERLNKIAVFLYIKKWIYLYDMYMSFFIFIRYNVSFTWKIFRKIVKPTKHESGLRRDVPN